MLGRSFASLFLPLALLAQEPIVLKNTGEPIRVPFACAEDDLQAAGLLCTEDEPCPIFLELTAIAPAGKKLFLTGDLHATSGTVSSILLGSDDGGASWKEPAPRIRAADLDQIQFHDLEHGWVAGETAYPLPRDPFFLVSSDGGQSWRTRPVSEEGGPGSIQRFWFDSPEHGELVIDAGVSSPGGRYLSYESRTGGESWMIRGTFSEAPKIRRAPPSSDNPDFRIRPVGGKVYRIEKRTGDSKWDSLASFLIEVASCAIKPPEVKEPPATEAEQPAPKNYVEELKVGAPDGTQPGKKKGPRN